jgi:anti-repressor protein
MSKMEIYNNNSLNKTLPQIFNFESSQVRVVVDEKGEPWFFAKDIANILGYASTKDVTRILEPDEKDVHIVDTLGGAQKLAIINESGLYSLIFLSRKKEAKKFKKWVTSEVLPTIRKTGGFGIEIDLNDPKQLHQLVLNYTNRVIALEDKLASNQPKVSFYDDFSSSDGLYNLQNAARALGCNPNLFINSLKNHYLFYQGNALVPGQRYRNQGLFVVKSNIINNHVRYQTYITAKGLQYFAEHNYVKQANKNSTKHQLTYKSTIFSNQIMGEKSCLIGTN